MASNASTFYAIKVSFSSKGMSLCEIIEDSIEDYKYNSFSVLAFCNSFSNST